jgi:phosphotransferase system enzyme I (PtsI)
MAYGKRNVVGFLTAEGGPTSHMGLIIRSLGIPAVMGDFGIGEVLTTGTEVIIDGINGEVIINPDTETRQNYRRMRQQKQRHPLNVLRRARSIKAICRDGRQIQLAANLEIPGTYEEHLVRLGVGVGLYRTEFLYFTKQAFPDEEEQYRVYSRIVERFAPLPVTLRTFDLGGDKSVASTKTIRRLAGGVSGCRWTPRNFITASFGRCCGRRHRAISRFSYPWCRIHRKSSRPST